jgi:hypothetical protein
MAEDKAEDKAEDNIVAGDNMVAAGDNIDILGSLPYFYQ